MSEFMKELPKRTGALFLVVGVLLLVLVANGRLPLTGSIPFTAGWSLALTVLGAALVLAGGVILVVDWRNSSTEAGDARLASAAASGAALDRRSLQILGKSGLVRAFRIPSDNTLRLDRVCQLIEEEVSKGNGYLRLAASSGYSYLNPNGAVWKSAGIGGLIESGKIKKLEVVLESPFAAFAETRALANNVTHTPWEEKQIIDHLVALLNHPNVDLRVTSESITCSLFMTSNALYYDPYLWSLPDALGRTENNFWVFEFDKVTDPQCVQMDCYGLLEKHFEFLQRRSVPLERLLHAPERGAKAPRNEQFYRLFQKNRELALNHYTELTREFHERLQKRLKEA